MRFAEAVSPVLALAGYEGAPEETTKFLADRFGEHIQSITKLCLSLRKALFQDIVSTDVKAISTKTSTQFNKAWMQDFYEEKLPPGTSATVACILEFGLVNMSARSYISLPKVILMHTLERVES